VPPVNRIRAKAMRREMTHAELKLWNELRAGRLMGLKFRRQMPIAGFIVDFACPAHRLIVEVDGETHANDAAERQDAARTQALERLGWHVLRFWNHDLISTMDDVCTHIIRVAGLGRAP
jgi:very-short-patch-repair endonuclease